MTEQIQKHVNFNTGMHTNNGFNRHLHKKPVKKREKARYRLSCGAVIFKFDQGRVYYLLLQSAQAKSRYWGFLKGAVELGETEEQTLNREVAEEVGMYNLKVVPHFRETQHYFYRYEGHLVRQDAVYFLAKAYDWKVKISHEHLDYKWCTYEEAINLMKLRPTRELITKAHIYIQSRSEQMQLL